MYSIYILLVVILLICVYSFYKAYSLAYILCHPKRWQNEIGRYIPTVYKKFDFVAGSKMLKGIDIRPKMKEKGTILVCHYLGGSKTMIFPFIDFLVASGYRILCFDFRNHGESQLDKRVRFSLEDDFCCFYEHVKKDISTPIGVIGFSMGSTPAILALEKYEEIKALVVDSGPLLFVKDYFNYVLDNKKVKNPIVRYFFNMIYLYYGGFYKMSQVTIEALNRLKGKAIFFIYSDKDHIIPIKNAELAMKHTQKNNRVHLWKVLCSRHLTNRFIGKDTYAKKVLEFFEENLEGGGEGIE